MCSTLRQITASAHTEADTPGFSQDVKEELEHSTWAPLGEQAQTRERKEKHKAQSQGGSQVSRRSRVSKGSKTQDSLPGY